MRFLYKHILAGVLAVVVMSSCSHASKKGVDKSGKPFEPQKLLKYDPKDADEKIDAFMQQLHKKNAFNGNVLVAKKGKILYEGSFGWANHLTRDSLKLDSRFELASVSKTMTGTAIMQLWEEGKIKLDQDVRDFYPNFPYQGVTIRLLLTHRSGMTLLMVCTAHSTLISKKELPTSR
jgi:CubicO group peptidase (beta-lactamase class C family)